MSIGGGFYQEPHISQFDGSPLASENCTPTTGANGANASTGGRIHMTGAQVRALIPRYLESNPKTPGWDLDDLDHAMAKIGVGFEVRSGRGWTAVITALDAGCYVALQGVSAIFSNATCSGHFNGTHCTGIHPAMRLNPVTGHRQRWLDDPICPKVGRWEDEAVLQRYAAAFDSNIRFGVFTTPVPHVGWDVRLARRLPWLAYHFYTVDTSMRATKVGGAQHPTTFRTLTGWHGGCSALTPVTENGAHLELVQITEPGHKFRGRWVYPGATGITLREVTP